MGLEPLGRRGGHQPRPLRAPPLLADPPPGRPHAPREHDWILLAKGGEEIAAKIGFAVEQGFDEAGDVFRAEGPHRGGEVEGGVGGEGARAGKGVSHRFRGGKGGRHLFLGVDTSLVKMVAGTVFASRFARDSVSRARAPVAAYSESVRCGEMKMSQSGKSVRTPSSQALMPASPVLISWPPPTRHTTTAQSACRSIAPMSSSGSVCVNPGSPFFRFMKEASCRASHARWASSNTTTWSAGADLSRSVASRKWWTF